MPKPEENKAASMPAEMEKPKGGTAIQTYDFGDDAGQGMENVDRSEYKIPFLRILDPKSPQCKPANVGGLGAKPGSIYNTATNEFYDEILFVPAHRDHYYAEYIKRNPDGSGGGFVAIRPVDDEYVMQLLATQGKFKKLITDTDPVHEIAETYALTGMAIPCKTDPKTFVSTPTGTAFPAVIGYASTQIKKYQTMVGRIMGFTYPGEGGKTIKPPIYAHMWHLTTTYESKGNMSWYGWVVRLAAKNADGTEASFRESMIKRTDQLYQDARGVYNAIIGGTAKVDHTKAGLSEGDSPVEDIPM